MEQLNSAKPSHCTCVTCMYKVQKLDGASTILMVKFASRALYAVRVKPEVYTLKNKGASKSSSSDAIEEPFLVPQRTIQSKVL